MALTLKLMSWNIGFCTLGGDPNFDTNQCQEMARKLGRYIAGAGPDIVFLSEVDVNTQRGGCMDQVHALAVASGMQHEAFGPSTESLEGPGQTRGQTGVAILSKHPLGPVTLTEVDPSYPKRIMYTTATINELRHHLHAVHWSAGENVAYRREKYAAKQVELISVLPPHEPVLLGGDLNAFQGTPEVTILRQVLTEAYGVPPPPIGCGRTDFSLAERIDYLFYRWPYYNLQSYDHNCMWDAEDANLPPADHPYVLAELNAPWWPENPYCDTIRAQIASHLQQIRVLEQEKVGLDPRLDIRAIREINQLIAAENTAINELNTQARSLHCLWF